MKIIENRDGCASRQDLQRRQPGEQLFGARARRACCSSWPPSIPSTGPMPPRCKLVRHDRRRILRARLPGRGRTACPRSTTRARELRLGAARRHARGAAADLRSLPRAAAARLAPAGLGPTGRSSYRCASRRHTVLIALKIDVDTLRGTREGVPALVRAAAAPRRRRHVPVQPGARSHRVGRSGGCSGPGFLSKVSRTSVLEHYGLRTLMYGTLLPGPDIGAARAARDARGARCRLRGRRALLRPRAPGRTSSRTRDADWTAQQMRRARERFERDLRLGAARARRGRLADERRRARVRGAARVRLRFGHARQRPFVPLVGGRRGRVARSCRPRCRRSTS